MDGLETRQYYRGPDGQLAEVRETWVEIGEADVADRAETAAEVAGHKPSPGNVWALLIQQRPLDGWVLDETATEDDYLQSLRVSAEARGDA